MESLFKKLEELSDLLKNIGAGLKLPQPGKTPTMPKPPKLPGINPPSKKDPVKIAQQLKNPKEAKPKTSVKISKLGQWSL